MLILSDALVSYWWTYVSVIDNSGVRLKCLIR